MTTEKQQAQAAVIALELAQAHGAMPQITATGASVALDMDGGFAALFHRLPDASGFATHMRYALTDSGGGEVEAEIYPVDDPRGCAQDVIAATGRCT